MKAANVCIIGLVFVVSVSAEPLFEGQVRLESGEPVADAQVRIFDMSDLRQGAIARALTDGTGYFALPLAALTGRALPARFALGPNYPNPFNPSTIIPYQLAASSAVRLEVFNLLGQRITTLVDGERAAGFHTATWHATDGAGRAAGAGVYIYRMTVGVESQTGRMVLIDGQAGVSAGGAASVMPGASGIGGSDGADAQMYGLIVSGSGLVPYVDPAFRVQAGMTPVELVVSPGLPSAGKATDDDCAFCDLFGTFNDQQEEEEDDETPEEEAETDSTSSEGGPDLIVQSPSVSAVMLTPGQEFTLHVTVHNQGDEQAAATTLHYYRSNNATITSSDTEVGTDAVGALDASATSAASIALTVPTSVSAEVGIYYGACVASVSDESNTDNNCSSAVKITLSGQEAPEEETQETPEEEETTEEEGDETPEEEEDEASEEEGSDGQVSIPDANLRAAIEAALGKARGAPITVADMETLNLLHAADRGISNLTGLEFATNLKRLFLEWNRITDISALGSLTNLTELWLNVNNITDISALGSLTNLTDLVLGRINTSDISVLGGLTNLKRLWVGGNNLSDSNVSVLSGLTNLTSLSLADTKITDVSVLRGLTNLTWLDLNNTKITDVSVLGGLTNLRTLWLSVANITDISVLGSLTNLTELWLLRNKIMDISALGGLTNLKELNLGENRITDVSVLGGLTDLTTLWLERNKIMDISALGDLTNLTRLELQFNNITDVSALGRLTNLTDLDLRENPLSDSSINDYIPALESSGATVLFDQFRKGDFDIELVFLYPFTEDQKNVLQYVARRWMSVITEDLPEYEFTQGWSGRCGDHSYTIPSGERIDDLRIYMTSFDGGGAAVGWGSPTLLRETSYLPVLGCMAFDLKWANLLITGIHEIGHVLGFGPIWDDLGFRQNLSWDDPNADTHFNGPLALAAFNDAGGGDYTGAKVPVQKMDGSHWRWPVLEGELMGPGGGGALSSITVQSLADLGYGVDVTQADAYTLPGAAAKASAKIAALPSISGYGMGISQADSYTLPGADPHWQGRIAGGLPSIFGDDRLIRRLAPHPHTEPQPLCGLVGEREPIYVVDQQGRIIRTLGD